jgi:hypothetical protein
MVEGFGAEVSATVQRTTFEGGNTKQRRNHRALPHMMRLRWTLPQTAYGIWTNWMNMYGWDWFEIALPSAVAGIKRTQLTPHSIRLTSDVDAELVNTTKGFYWQVSVEAEFVPPAGVL